MSCGVGCRRGLDLALLWLWRGLVATALIGPLAWEPPYAEEEALEKANTHTHTHKKCKNSRQEHHGSIQKLGICRALSESRKWNV